MVRFPEQNLVVGHEQTKLGRSRGEMKRQGPHMKQQILFKSHLPLHKVKKETSNISLIKPFMTKGFDFM